MQLAADPFRTIDWSKVEATIHPGDVGTAEWQTQYLGDVRVRMVRYSPGYEADHWCSKGHVLHVLEGVLDSQLGEGRTVTLGPGESYLVGDDSQPLRSVTSTGALLFIVD
jgi:quercetin dioxygenase-like cupin family protein